MRLTDEQIKVTLSELDKMKLHTIVEGGLKLMLKDFADTIEALQQEIDIQTINTKTYLQEADKLQQEVEHWKGHAESMEINRDAFAGIVQQLQAQNGACKEEVLKKVADVNNYDTEELTPPYCDMGLSFEQTIEIDNYISKIMKYASQIAVGIMDDIFTDTPTTYHNPADVDALAKAREALSHMMGTYECNFGCACCNKDKVLCSYYQEGKVMDEALEQIDKVGGGK